MIMVFQSITYDFSSIGLQFVKNKIFVYNILIIICSILVTELKILRDYIDITSLLS